MGGLAVLLILIAYFVLTIYIMVKTPKAWSKVLVLVVAFLIPTADAMWGRYVVMPRLCKDAGLKVFRHASKADGLMYGMTPDDYYLSGTGLLFVEGQMPNGSYSRVSLVSGKVETEFDVTPKAKYVLKNWKSTPIEFGKHFSMQELRIEGRWSGILVAEIRNYSFAGGWAEGALRVRSCIQSFLSIKQKMMQLKTWFRSR